MSKNVGGHQVEHHLSNILKMGTNYIVYHSGQFMLVNITGQTEASGDDLNDMIADYYARRARQLRVVK